MRLTFTVSLLGIALLFATLWKYEIAAKNARMQTRRLRRMLLGEDAVRPLEGAPRRHDSLLAAAPALPLHTAGKYVAGAYIVFLVIILIYVAIMATRLSRTERDLVELQRDLQARAGRRGARFASVEAEPVG